MPTSKGRSSGETRTATVGTTNTSTALTGAAGTFYKGGVGAKITGTGIPAAATITAVASDTAATLSAAATATGSPTATIGPGTPGVYGFLGWAPETDAQRDSRKAVPVGTPPEVITAPNLQRSDFGVAR